MEESVRAEGTNALLIRTDRVLLLQDRVGHWNFPGGTREANDVDMLDCVVREVIEETGIQLGRHALHLFFQYTNYSDLSGRDDRGPIVEYYYWAKTDSDCVDESNVAVPHAWLTPDQALARLGTHDAAALTLYLRTTV